MSLGGTPQARGNRGGRRIKVLWVQAASDSYIYTFRGFSISRFVERVRARGVNATPLQITVPGEDLYLSEVAELAWSTWLEIGWLVTGYQKFHAYRRLLLRSRTRACHFSFAPRDLISQPDMEWAVSNTHEQRPTSPLVFENPRVSDCAANQIYFTCSLLKLFILYFGLIFFFFCTSFSIFNRIFSWQLARRYYNDFSYIRFNFNKANLVVHLRRDDSKQHWKHSIEVSWGISNITPHYWIVSMYLTRCSRRN